MGFWTMGGVVCAEASDKRVIPGNRVGAHAVPDVRAPVTQGFLVLLLLFGGFFSWACFAPLAEATHAVGASKVERNRRPVQHLEGGIVREILVGEGDRVDVGQPLIRLDDIQIESQHRVLRAQRLALLAQEARLAAEGGFLEEVVWPRDLLDVFEDERVVEVLEDQRKLFFARKVAFESARSGLWAKIAQLTAEQDSLTKQIASIESQITLIREEMDGVKELLRLGLERRPRLLALQRAEAGLIGDLERIRGQISKNEAILNETSLQIQALVAEREVEVKKEQRVVRDQLVEVEERLKHVSSVVTRHEIVAPASGVVIGLKVFSIGQVIKPGEVVLEVVPDEKLKGEVLILPSDVDSVAVGQTAAVRFPGLKQRSLPPLSGHVEYVSADAVWDEILRAHVFKAYIQLNNEETSKLLGINLMPGMPIEVSIEVGQRTLWRYLTEPLSDSFRRAFSEP